MFTTDKINTFIAEVIIANTEAHWPSVVNLHNSLCKRHTVSICCHLFSLHSRSAGLALHSRGDLYVHGETTPVHLFGRDAGETAIRHPLPRGPSQRLRRLDNPTFLSVYTYLNSSTPNYLPSPASPLTLLDLPLRQTISSLCSAAPNKTTHFYFVWFQFEWLINALHVYPCVFSFLNHS